MGASIATRMAPLTAGAGTGLFVYLGAVTFDPPAVDLATPGAGRHPSLFDEFLEAAQVALNAQVVRTQHVADPLGQSGGLPVHLELRLRLALAERDEAHDPFISRARSASPRDDAVRDLLCYLRVPLFDRAPDLGAPVKSLVVELLDGFDTFHESRELLELGPLVIGDPDRNVDFDRFLQSRHA